MDFQLVPTWQWVVFVIEVILFCIGCHLLYLQITNPFRDEAERQKEKLRVKETCDGCGSIFPHQLHYHYGYKSCSVECDEWLDELFIEMNF